MMHARCAESLEEACRSVGKGGKNAPARLMADYNYRNVGRIEVAPALPGSL